MKQISQILTAVCLIFVLGVTSVHAQEEQEMSETKINRAIREAKKLNDAELHQLIVELGILANSKEGLPTRQAQMERWQRMSPEQRLQWRSKMAQTWDKQSPQEKEYMVDTTIERLAAMPSEEREAVLKALEDSIAEGTVAP